MGDLPCLDLDQAGVQLFQDLDLQRPCPAVSKTKRTPAGCRDDLDLEGLVSHFAAKGEQDKSLVHTHGQIGLLFVFLVDGEVSFRDTVVPACLQPWPDPDAVVAERVGEKVSRHLEVRCRHRDGEIGAAGAVHQNTGQGAAALGRGFPVW